jgi:hypothetical protein
MPIFVKGSGDFTPAPEGLHAAVCVDIIDKGLIDTKFGPKHQVRVIWEISFLRDDGRPFTVGRTYTASLHQQSNLRKHLEAWRGRAFTAEEVAGFDLEKVLGTPCQLLVQHADVDGTIFANVGNVMKAQPGPKQKPSGCYTRWKDRPENQAKAPTSAPNPAGPPEQEPVPF